VGDPRIDDLVGRFVVPQGLDQYLPAPIELPAKDSMRAVGLAERSAAVLDGRPEVLCGMLVLEAFDALALRPGEQEANHRVFEAPVDEIVDDQSQRWLPTELFKQAHLRDDPDAMYGVDQVGSIGRALLKMAAAKKIRQKQAASSKDRN
jgi:hypothetical protein